MKEFSRCPSCGCSVDEMLRGHHSAADCSILKYGEREAVEALAQAEENIWRWLCGETLDNYPPSRDKLHAAILADEPKEECGEERHPLDPQNPCTDCANSVGPRPDAICDECEGDESAKPSMWRPRAEVERRIEEAGR